MLKNYQPKCTDINFLEIKAVCSKKQWLRKFEAPGFEEIHQTIEQFGENISRAYIINHIKNATNSELSGFLLTYYWGYDGDEKPDHRGAGRVLKIISTHGIEEVKNVLSEVRMLLIGNQIETALKRINQIKYTGVSFNSKYLYFLGKAMELSKYPLIFDRRVATGLLSIVDIGNELIRIITATPATTEQAYLEYVRSIHYLAEKTGFEADAIEYLIFIKGRDVAKPSASRKLN